MQLTGKRIQLSPLDHSDKDLFIELSMSAQMMEHVYTPCTYDEAKAVLWRKHSLGMKQVIAGLPWA